LFYRSQVTGGILRKGRNDVWSVEDVLEGAEEDGGPEEEGDEVVCYEVGFYGRVLRYEGWG
jgi:hypothetical protein